MLNITDYAFLFQNSYNKSKTNLFASSSNGIFTSIGSFQLKNLNSSAVQSRLKAEGIDTNSKQYKAVIKEMTKAANGNGAMYTNIQAIKNLMKNYDSDGDWVDPTTGLAGLLVTDENDADRRTIISIPESSRREMFESTKREFLAENGVANGDTTKRSDVYTNLYRKMEKQDRLKAGYTLEQYERAYSRAFHAAAKAADPNWEIGKPIPKGALDNITMESVEKELVQVGNKFVTSTSSSSSAVNTTASSYSRKTVSSVETAFSEGLKNNPPKIIQAEEKEVEIDSNVAIEKMKRLEEQLRNGTFKSNSDFDMKA
ncbi:MAG: DUF3879 family protein [Ruminococcaceae bacterium]|nr:DUF3879 family protein [Oscillospiraceae bacterium]